MDLDNEQTIKLIQANAMLSLQDYEEKNGNKNRFADILFVVNDVHAQVSEQTLEVVLFKYFIGELNMKKIVFELFKGNKIKKEIE